MPDPLQPAAAQEAAAVVRRRCPLLPLVGLVLGSGLGDLAEQVESPSSIAFADIPGHPATTVAGHAGRLVLGRLEGLPVAVWQGRGHFYEGWTMAEVAFPVRLLAALGGRAVLLTNAAGGLNQAFEAGDLMLLTDHISLPGLVGHSPLRGAHDAAAGERFVDLVDAYDPALRELAQRVGARSGLRLRQGVYVMVAGPSFETPAEARLLRLLGADAVGMSTVPEVVVARQLGLRVLGLSAITNVLLQPGGGGTSHAEVLAAAERVKPRFAALIHGILGGMAEVLGA